MQVKGPAISNTAAKSHFACASFGTLIIQEVFISAKKPKMSSLTVFEGNILCMQKPPSLSISGLQCKPTHVTQKNFILLKTGGNNTAI